jgi:three-Cys-motif partner protein
MVKDDAEFFDELYEWSARKHSLMRKYVNGAARYLSSNRLGKTLFYIDGFAGKGRYGNPDKGIDYQPGSPLLMAQLAQTALDKGYGYSIKCINVEADRKNFETLCEVTAPYSGIVTNFHGEFVDHIDAILALVERQPVVAFLDPFGLKGLSMTLVERILGRSEPTDIWIRFNANEVMRRWGWYQNGVKGWQAHFGILQDIYGISDGQKLYDEIGSSGDSTGRKRNALQLYRQQLLSKFPASKGKRYAASYRIGSIKNEEKYHLVLAAAKGEALRLASDIISGERDAFERDRELYEEEANPQMSLLGMLKEIDPDSVTRVKVEKLATFIAERYSGKPRTRLHHHLNLCLDGWFGRIKGSELTSAFKQLIQQRKAELIDETGTVSDPKAVILIK